ncbi:MULTISPECIES: hypothetical protein [unclassified Pandoraea]|uniref:hypothetical protein n=1 Tax=unclassified Pandoraea TaxID=2624094 RepID=UPI003965C997
MLTLKTGRAKAFALDDVLLAGLRATARKPGDFVIVGGLFVLSGRCFYALFTPRLSLLSPSLRVDPYRSRHGWHAHARARRVRGVPAATR